MLKSTRLRYLGVGYTKIFERYIQLLRKKTKMLFEKLSEATRIVNNLDIELHFGKHEESEAETNV